LTGKLGIASSQFPGVAFISAQLESGTSQTLINEMGSLISTKQPVATEKKQERYRRERERNKCKKVQENGKPS